VDKKFLDNIELKKRCGKCEKYKNLETDFYNERGGKYKKNECKKCIIDRSNEYRNRDGRKVIGKKLDAKRYKKNKIEINKRTRQWEVDHAEYVNIRVKIGYYKKKIFDKTGRKIEFPRKYVKYSEESLQYMKVRLEKVKKIYGKLHK